MGRFSIKLGEASIYVIKPSSRDLVFGKKHIPFLLFLMLYMGVGVSLKYENTNHGKYNYIVSFVVG